MVAHFRGSIDVEATVAEAFGVGPPVSGSGVLVLAGGQYLACTKRAAAADGSFGLSARNVVSGTDSSLAAAVFAQHVLHDQCFRVQPVVS